MVEANEKIGARVNFVRWTTRVGGTSNLPVKYSRLDWSLKRSRRSLHCPLALIDSVRSISAERNVNQLGYAYAYCHCGRRNPDKPCRQAAIEKSDLERRILRFLDSIIDFEKFDQWAVAVPASDLIVQRIAGMLPDPAIFPPAEQLWKLCENIGYMQHLLALFREIKNYLKAGTSPSDSPVSFSSHGTKFTGK